MCPDSLALATPDPEVNRRTIWRVGAESAAEAFRQKVVECCRHSDLSEVKVHVYDIKGDLTLTKQETLDAYLSVA